MKVVCINNKYERYLTIGKVYETGGIDYVDFVLVRNDTGYLSAYLKTNFISIKEYRKMKLQKIITEERRNKLEKLNKL